MPSFGRIALISVAVASLCHGVLFGGCCFLEFITDYLNSVNSGQAGILFLSSLFLIWMERGFFF